MIERFWLICGADMLGMAPMERNIGPCRHNHHIDAIPVTPIMDTQLDEIAIRDVLIPLKTRLLRILKAKVLAKKKEYWYEICLATFIILHNSERVLDHVVDFARRFGVSVSVQENCTFRILTILFPQPKPKANDESSLSHAYYHACKTLLAYFHFASGGATPLALDWGGPTQDSSIVDQHQVAYLRNIKTEILRQGQSELSLRMLESIGDNCSKIPSCSASRTSRCMRRNCIGAIRCCFRIGKQTCRTLASSWNSRRRISYAREPGFVDQSMLA